MFESIMDRIRDRIRRIRELIKRWRNGGSISRINFGINSFSRSSLSAGFGSSMDARFASSQVNSAIASNNSSSGAYNINSEQDSSMLII